MGGVTGRARRVAVRIEHRLILLKFIDLEHFSCELRGKFEEARDV